MARIDHNCCIYALQYKVYCRLPPLRILSHYSTQCRTSYMHSTILFLNGENKPHPPCLGQIMYLGEDVPEDGHHFILGRLSKKFTPPCPVCFKKSYVRSFLIICITTRKLIMMCSTTIVTLRVKKVYNFAAFFPCQMHIALLCYHR